MERNDMVPNRDNTCCDCSSSADAAAQYLPQQAAAGRGSLPCRRAWNICPRCRRRKQRSESLPEITAKPELLTDAKTLFPMEYGTDADVIFFADLDHDGEPERITAGLDDFAGIRRTICLP
ncbi:MAG: hypothetical protein ACLTBV_21755 [Enterocloster bolteae]